MRTTVDLPAELMQAAKIKAAQRGESLKVLFARAIARDVAAGGTGRPGGRLVLPLIGRDQQPQVEFTNADIEAVFEDEDVERYGR